MPPLADNNVRQMLALFDMISDVEKNAHPLLWLISEAIQAYKDDNQELDIKSDYNGGLWLVRHKSQDLSICARDWTAP